MKRFRETVEPRMNLTLAASMFLVMVLIGSKEKDLIAHFIPGFRFSDGFQSFYALSDS